MRVVIIGGVAGGMSAATRLRRLDNSAEIIVLERSAHVSYANCGLPYYVGGVIDRRSDLLLQTPESLNQRFNLDVRVHHEVTEIDRAAKFVRGRRLDENDEFEFSYDYLILSPGASPVIPPIPGIERALALRTVEDVERMAAALDNSARHAVVIGGGFIGVEVAENLAERGVATTVVEAMDQVLAPLDPEMAILVADEMRRHNVDVRLGDGVEAITPTAVQLRSGEIVPADLVVVAIGVRPDASLARLAGLEIGTTGGIAVDDFNRSSDLSIYAIGDVAEKIDALDGAATLVPLANVANRHGRIVADHVVGRRVRPRATIGTAIVKVFDLTVAVTGWSEKRLVASGRAYAAIHTHPSHHASYYPGAQQMALKVLIDPTTGEILGAQGVGTEGVDKRIDVLATAIRGDITAPELADLELAYAPPFGSAKDPVNMLGYIAENVISGLVKTAQWSEVEGYRSDGAVLLDVRTEAEFVRGHVPGSLNIPVDEIRERFGELDVTRPIVVICRVGHRGHTATRLLNELGFDALNLDGGYLTWSSSPAARDFELIG